MSIGSFHRYAIFPATLLFSACDAPSQEMISDNVSVAEKETGAEICSGDVLDYPQRPPLGEPWRKDDVPATYIYEVDEDIFRFSPHLARSVFSRIQTSVSSFDKEAEMASISERQSDWIMTASTSQIAVVVNRLTTLSQRFPKGVVVNRTYLYNRGTETLFEIGDLFANKDIADRILKQNLVDSLVVSRAETLDRQADDMLKRETDEAFTRRNFRCA